MNAFSCVFIISTLVEEKLHKDSCIFCICIQEFSRTGYFLQSPPQLISSTESYKIDFLKKFRLERSEIVKTNANVSRNYTHLLELQCMKH